MAPCTQGPQSAARVEGFQHKRYLRARTLRKLSFQAAVPGPRSDILPVLSVLDEAPASPHPQ